ncbi:MULTISPECIES: RHS repeat domain-containing protein [Acinetobacter]|jgi:YD repeat-containing protein|uniref:RHS repeat domain-containing protein n=1 Tax=Acinetobacter TaxID=469 RepID=UPI001250C734|nr:MULTISPECIES: RHS repeat domain-containing protein [Acinetobacter]MBJ9901583.1 RHS repeat protein [Acinetobacter bereziniae]MCU4318049.1 RHS repeat protein [Acinetobacter bereziniae]MCU4598593.1 RHS repeat protein [Acinetobacter bereziniae]MDR0237797.1 RHS repeat protein [Acinetobacter sp.]
MKKIIFICLSLILSSSTLYAETADYKYDSAGRLTEIIYSSGKKVVYTYDAVGNRVTMTGTNADGSEMVDIEWLMPILSLILDDDE